MMNAPPPHRTIPTWAALLFVVVVVLVLVLVVWLVAGRGGMGRGAGGGGAPPAAAGSGAVSAETAAVIERSRSAHAFAGEPRVVAAPAERSRVQVVRNEAYTVGFSNVRREPLWCAYTLPVRSEYYDVRRPKSIKFAADTRTEASVRHDDYSGSGYDRGHMAPSDAIGRWFGPDAQLTTFLTSNIAPQRHPLNDGDWGGLEAAEQHIWAREFGQVWVMAGPVFEGTVSTIGPGIAVPTAFYRIVVRVTPEGMPDALAVIIPQETTGVHPLSMWITTVRVIEQKTGLDFMWELPDAEEERVETTPAGAAWRPELVLDDNAIRRRAR